MDLVPSNFRDGDFVFDKTKKRGQTEEATSSESGQPFDVIPSYQPYQLHHIEEPEESIAVSVPKKKLYGKRRSPGAPNFVYKILILILKGRKSIVFGTLICLFILFFVILVSVQTNSIVIKRLELKIGTGNYDCVITGPSLFAFIARNYCRRQDPVLSGKVSCANY